MFYILYPVDRVQCFQIIQYSLYNIILYTVQYYLTLFSLVSHLCLITKKCNELLIVSLTCCYLKMLLLIHPHQVKLAWRGGPILYTVHILGKILTSTYSSYRLQLLYLYCRSLLGPLSMLAFI